MSTYMSMNTFLSNLNELQNLLNQLYSNGEYSQKERAEAICSLIRHKVYNTPKWNAAAGLINTNFCNYVKSQNPNLFEIMSQTDLVVTDYLGQEIDVPHWAATIDGYLSISPIKDEWNGWAGDLGSLIQKIQQMTNNSQDYNWIINVAKNHFLYSGSVFSKQDLVSDIDAENIVNRINLSPSSNFSQVVSSYYNSGYSKRYTEFVGRRDGSTYFMGNIMRIMNDPYLYAALDITTPPPTSDQIYAVTGVFTTHILDLMRQGL